MILNDPMSFNFKDDYGNQEYGEFKYYEKIT